MGNDDFVLLTGYKYFGIPSVGGCQISECIFFIIPLRINLVGGNYAVTCV